jgi:hypothetical protein
MKRWWTNLPKRYLPDRLTMELIQWYGRRKLRGELHRAHRDWEARQQ